VLVSFDGDVKLVDFGIAKATAKTRATRTGTIKGKLAYMSPEQLRGDLIDRRADVFSLGVVAYELATGQRCFYAAGEFALINRVAAAKFERPSAVRPDFPPELEAIVVKALAADPAERFATARELQVAIEAYAARSGIPMSKVGLSEYMGATFGFEAYPVTTAILLPQREETVPSGMSTLDVSAIRRPMRRRTMWLTGIAMATGIAVGVGLPALLGPDAATSADPRPAAARPTPEIEPPPPSPVEPDPPPAAQPVVAPPPEPELVETTPSTESEPRRARRSRGKRSRKGKRPQPSTAKPKTNEYLPPSRRD
jgi:serine/threonine-protein kinase